MVMVNENTLILENNLSDISNMDNYSTLKMIGCIFTPSLKEYIDICKRCGVFIDDNENDTEIGNILFDLSTKFLLSKIGNINNPKISKIGINKILHDTVYPGEFEINTNDYEIQYNQWDYFKVVSSILGKSGIDVIKYTIDYANNN